MVEFQVDPSDQEPQVSSFSSQGLGCENKPGVPSSLSGAVNSEKAKLGSLNSKLMGRLDGVSPGRNGVGESHGGLVSSESHGVCRDMTQDRNM